MKPNNLNLRSNRQLPSIYINPIDRRIDKIMLIQEFVTASGTSTTVDNTLIEALKEHFQGEIIRPSDAGYDDARSIWNAMINKYPALIARCTNRDDVVEAVNFARDNNIVLSVRGSGHNVAGNAVCDGGLRGVLLSDCIRLDYVAVLS